ncbi:hypothetical protein B0H11DRAFT_1915251 [Mycena galericulata]|nr:hypothetical protein B0H11DRAFT_1915251 [Mycena galericulata]
MPATGAGDYRASAIRGILWGLVTLVFASSILDPMRYDFDLPDWQRQVDFASSCTDEFAVRRVLAAMSSERLFDAALVSAELFRKVTAYLDHLKDCGDDEEALSDTDASDNAMSDDSDGERDLIGCSMESRAGTTFAMLPSDVGLQIIRDLVLVDRLSVARVSRSCALLVADALQVAASVQLARFKLRFDYMRLMQAATGAVFAGSILTALAHSGSPFVPGDVDIVTGYGRGFDVMCFLAYMDYAVVEKSDSYKYTAGIGKIWTMRHKHADLKVNILESLTHNPLDAVCHFHSTCVFGRAITTPSRLPVDAGVDSQTRVWPILHKYMRRGFVYSLDDYEAPHSRDLLLVDGRVWMYARHPHATLACSSSLGVFVSHIYLTHYVVGAWSFTIRYLMAKSEPSTGNTSIFVVTRALARQAVASPFLREALA